MNAREKILAEVKKNKPNSTALPTLETFEGQINQADLYTKFGEMLHKIGGKQIVLQNIEEANSLIKNNYQEFKNIASNIDAINVTNVNLNAIIDPHELENVDLAIIKGEFGVAENGSIWISCKNLIHNAIPFITQHLILIIKKSDIVENMHLAYKNIHFQDLQYGVFIAGPSKTADIEQSLVIGAHGSRSLLVIATEY